MSRSLLQRLVLALTCFFVAPIPTTAHAQVVTTTVSSSGAGLQFGEVSSDASKAVAITGRSRVVDVDVRFEAEAGCDGTLESSIAAVEHPRIGDISITLISPQGTLVTLQAQRGGARDNICSVVFDDDGGFPSITTLSSVNGQPMTGSFAPENPLSAFDDEDPNGGWTMRVADGVVGVSGRFNRFTLVLQTAPVQDIVVDLLDDPVPSGCTPGSCSLREAVLLANARPGLDRIVLPAGQLQLARAGSNEDAADTGDLDITESIELVGQGIDATQVLQLASDRLLHNLGASEITVRRLTLSGGKAVDRGGAVLSGGRFAASEVRFAGNRATVTGGAIHHSGSGRQDWPIRLELVESEFIDNHAQAGSGPASYGGAIYAVSTGFQADHGFIDRCDFIENEADNGGGAVALSAIQSISGTGYTIRFATFVDNRVTDSGRGGAIGTNLDENGIVNLTILGSAFEGNLTSGVDPDDHSGGAIRMASGQLILLASSLFRENESGVGGALDLIAMADIHDTTFAYNVAETGGGAIRALYGVNIERSTLHDNTVTSVNVNDPGGGGLLTVGNTSIKRSTFDNNIAFRGGAITTTDGNLVLVNNTLTTLGFNLPPGADASILRYLSTDATETLSFYANLVIGRCLYTGSAIVPDASSYNIEASGNTCRFLQATLPVGNQVSQSVTAVNLGPLALNGGPTATRLPLAPSIAINAAGNLGCPALDQRGYARTDNSCDVGAVEASGVEPSPVVFADGFES